MSGLPDHMTSEHKSTIENVILRAAIQSDHIEDIRPSSINYEDEMPSEDPESVVKNVVAEEVQINIDPDSNLGTERLFFRIKANIDKEGELVNWIRINDGPNRFVAQGESNVNKEMVANLAEGIDHYLEENY